MSKQEIYDFLKELELCDTCVLRYLNARCTEYENIDESFSTKGIIRKEVNGQENGITDAAKRSKPNICCACLGIFQNDFLDEVAKEVIENSNLNLYESNTLYTSVSIPILLHLRELSLWIALIEKFKTVFMDTTNNTEPPNISIKETFKYLMNIKLCKATNRELEQNQDGILVNLFFDHDADKEEIERLYIVAPASMDNRPTKWTKHKPKRKPITRNLFEKHFYPDNLNLDDCIKHLPVPPSPVSVPIKFTKCSISGPTIFVAGRYRKLSRNLSQSPWIIDNKRMKEDSLQEIIAKELAPYFGIDPIEQSDKITFMSSGREDIDVRCLGKGRPFVMEFTDSRIATLPKEVAADMECRVDSSQQVSIQHLQLVKREDLVHIKTGEETKKKIYRALCILKEPVTLEIMQKLDIPNGFTIQQLTPLRVLHRRPLLTRPRQLFSVKGYVNKDNLKMVILDLVTQAGTYIKELVHGEFGRTSPSISSIIDREIDIVELDVNGIDLDWPAEIDNKSNDNEHTIE